MLNLLLVWAALFVVLIVFAIGRRGRSGALTLAYFLGLSLIHVPGVLPFIGSEPFLADRTVTRIGFETTLLGMAAFVAGAIVARRNLGFARRSAANARRRGRVFEHLGWRTFAFGAIAYFLFLPLSRYLPSVTSFISAVATLLIIGIWLALYGAVEAGDNRRLLAILALLPLLPLATLVTGGFLGYGVYWIIGIVALLFTITRRRAWFYLAAPFVLYFGLSLAVTYLAQRAGIREVVWQERASLLDRLDRASRIVTDFEWLDLSSPAQDVALDSRLNQNRLVGAAIEYHEAGFAHYAYGATVPLWALIPRAVWPEKPAVGGGGEVVSEFTGVGFAPGTSIGAGQVLEFYVNFGIAGVLVGFLGLGYLLMRLDRGIMRALAAGDSRALLLRAMPGLTLLQPGGNLLEILVAFVAAFVAAHLVLELRFFELPPAIRARIERRFLPGSGAEQRR